MLDFSSQIGNDTITTFDVAQDDDHHFSDLHTGEVEVGFETIGHPLADDIIVPFTKNGTRFELAFIGARADLYQQTVGAALAAIEAVGGIPRKTIKVTGSWVKREWTGRNGQTNHTWRLVVAQWSCDNTLAGHIPA